MFEVSSWRKIILAGSILFFVFVLVPFLYHILQKPPAPKTKQQIHQELESVANRMRQDEGTTTTTATAEQLLDVSARMRAAQTK